MHSISIVRGLRSYRAIPSLTSVSNHVTDEGWKLSISTATDVQESWLQSLSCFHDLHMLTLLLIISYSHSHAPSCVHPHPQECNCAEWTCVVPGNSHLPCTVGELILHQHQRVDSEGTSQVAPASTGWWASGSSGCSTTLAKSAGGQRLFEPRADWCMWWRLWKYFIQWSGAALSDERAQDKGTVGGSQSQYLRNTETKGGWFAWGSPSNCQRSSRPLSPRKGARSRGSEGGSFSTSII